MDLSKLKSVFQKYPRLANSVVYGSLYVGAEYSQQIITKNLSDEKDKERTIDYKALGRYLFIGSFINANYLYSWYKWLDRRYVGTHKQIIIKKVLLDQFVMTPPLYVIFFVSMSLLEGKENLLEECRTKFLKTFSEILGKMSQYRLNNELSITSRSVIISECLSVPVTPEKMIVLVEPCDLRNYMAVIPSVCVGNVGQLTSDLLISSFNLTKLGYVWHSEVLTFSGAEPFKHSNNFSTACELFFSKKLKLIVFQIRSALRKNIKIFLEDMCIWLKENEIRQVVILTGISAHRRGDGQLIGEPLRYLFCPSTKLEELKGAVNRNWVELEIKHTRNDLSSSSLPSYTPGAGIAVKWFQKCIKEKIPCSILFEFCSDGNNAPDALKLADYLDQWLQLKEKHQIQEWVIPPSWNLLFGSQPPTEIFN